ncbi:MAG: hypothetical protein ACK5NT_05985 [Pyrinomonadaceae bacterium]
MKRCPQCNVIYKDDSLNFCIQDGTVLISANEITNDTEPETVISNINPNRIHVQINSAEEQTEAFKTPPNYLNQPAQASSNDSENKGKRNAKLVLLGFVAVLFVVVLGGTLAYFLLKSQRSEEVISPIGKNDETETNIDSRKPSPAPTGNNAKTTSQEVNATLARWKKALEARNLDAVMSNYANNVNYYSKKNATKAFVRADKQKGFQKFDSVRTQFSNIRIASSSDGKTATASFDKEFKNTGINGDSSGKVMSEVTFKNVEGKWLITDERDVKVYYVNK